MTPYKPLGSFWSPIFQNAKWCQCGISLFVCQDMWKGQKKPKKNAIICDSYFLGSFFCLSIGLFSVCMCIFIVSVGMYELLQNILLKLWALCMYNKLTQNIRLENPLLSALQVWAASEAKQRQGSSFTEVIACPFRGLALMPSDHSQLAEYL